MPTAALARYVVENRGWETREMKAIRNSMEREVTSIGDGNADSEVQADQARTEDYWRRLGAR